MKKCTRKWKLKGFFLAVGSSGYVRTIDNMHVMTLIGYDEGTGAYLVNDPNSYTKNQYWVKKDEFEKAYDALKYAIVVR